MFAVQGTLSNKSAIFIFSLNLGLDFWCEQNFSLNFLATSVGQHQRKHKLYEWLIQNIIQLIIRLIFEGNSRSSVCETMSKKNSPTPPSSY